MRILTTILFSMLSFCADAQETLELRDLKTPDSPGFQILDVAPASIEKPDNPKAFAASLYSLASSGTGFPKNFALEFAPYWFVKSDNASFYKYLNISENADKSYRFTGLLNKLSVSVTSVYSDEDSGSLLAETNYMAIGIRTNLFTYRTKDQSKRMTDAATAISERLNAISSQQETRKNLQNSVAELNRRIGEEPDAEKKGALRLERHLIELQIAKLQKAAPDEIQKKVEADQTITDNYKILDESPLLSFDGAFAYSEAIPGNVYANRRFNRSGFWLTGALSGFNLTKDDNLSFIASFRMFKDNLAVMTGEVTTYMKERSSDLGGKIEYRYKDLTLAVEHLKRIYSDEAIKDSERTVGLMQYKINESLYLTGSYGRNFGAGENLVSVFGLNWSFGSTVVSSNP